MTSKRGLLNSPTNSKTALLRNPASSRRALLTKEPVYEEKSHAEEPCKKSPANTFELQDMQPPSTASSSRAIDPKVWFFFQGLKV